MISRKKNEEKNKILIIGTEPPCPRCGLISNIITDKVKELGLEAEVRHLSYTDQESREIAKKLGLKAGTAKDVAQLINSPIDKNKLTKFLQNKSECAREYKSYNDCNWTPELDEFLKPYEKKAKEAGVLMTPILIINGELKHSGSVPELQKIHDWLSETIK